MEQLLALLAVGGGLYAALSAKKKTTPTGSGGGGGAINPALLTAGNSGMQTGPTSQATAPQTEIAVGSTVDASKIISTTTSILGTGAGVVVTMYKTGLFSGGSAAAGSSGASGAAGAGASGASGASGTSGGTAGAVAGGSGLGTIAINAAVVAVYIIVFALMVWLGDRTRIAAERWGAWFNMGFRARFWTLVDGNIYALFRAVRISMLNSWCNAKASANGTMCVFDAKVVNLGAGKSGWVFNPTAADAVDNSRDNQIIAQAGLTSQAPYITSEFISNQRDLIPTLDDRGVYVNSLHIWQTPQAIKQQLYETAYWWAAEQDWAYNEAVHAFFLSKGYAANNTPGSWAGDAYWKLVNSVGDDPFWGSVQFNSDAVLRGTNFDSWTNTAYGFLGKENFDRLANIAHFKGFCLAASRASDVGFSIGWPGDREFTYEILNRCKLSYYGWDVVEQKTQGKRTLYWLKDPATGLYFNPILSRERTSGNNAAVIVSDEANLASFGGQ